MNAPIFTAEIQTPFGPMLAAASPEGVCLLEFLDRERLESQLKRVAQLLHREVQPGACEHLDQLKDELEAYFACRRQTFEVAVVLPGTVFQQAMWEMLRKVPYGQTRTYQQIARQLGRPALARAVGAANASNPIAIVVPCHRLVGHDGSLTGYGGGIWRKQKLLELEKSSLA